MLRYFYGYFDFGLEQQEDGADGYDGPRHLPGVVGEGGGKLPGGVPGGGDVRQGGGGIYRLFLHFYTKILADVWS